MNQRDGKQVGEQSAFDLVLYLYDCTIKLFCATTAIGLTFVVSSWMGITFERIVNTKDMRLAITSQAEEPKHDQRHSSFLPSLETRI